MSKVIVGAGLLVGASLPVFGAVAAFQWLVYSEVNWTMCAYTGAVMGLIGLWATRGGRERRKAKELLSLSERTIAAMEAMLTGMDPQTSDRMLIEEHLQARMKARDRYSMLVRGETDTMEKLRPTLRYYHLHRQAMEKEIGGFGTDVTTFVAYLKALSSDQRPD